METPAEVLDEREQPLVVVASESSPLREVEEQIRKAMKRQLRQFAAAATSPSQGPATPTTSSAADWDRSVRVSYHPLETAAWVPLTSATTATESSAAATSSGFRSAAATSVCVGELELEQRDYRVGKARFHHVLVETRFKAPSGDGSDWRHGKFWSDMEANKWRYELTLGQLIDARDSEKKWCVRALAAGCWSLLTVSHSFDAYCRLVFA